MSSKGFLTLVVGVLVLGAAIGGSFVAGLALGDGDSPQVVEAAVTTQPPGSVGSQLSGSSDGLSLDQIRQQFQSGQLGQEDLARLRQQTQGQTGQEGFDGGGFGGGRLGGGGLRGGFAGGGLTGTIEKIEGNTVTVNTPQGPLQTFVGPDTVIQKTTQVSIDDIVEGLRVTVSGERNESGIVEATLIFLLPEGTEGFTPGGFTAGGLPSSP